MGIFSKVFGSYSTRELARIEPLKKRFWSWTRSIRHFLMQI